MKLGVMAAPFSSQGLDAALKYTAEKGLDAIEIPTGNYPGDGLCNAAEMLKSKKKRDGLAAKVKDHGLEISALSCHGNPWGPSFSRNGAGSNCSTLKTPAPFHSPVSIIMAPIMAGTPVV